ncbi:hypothetical protein F7018_15555 [Tenacibaculum aiptasiae]|uniref:Uncharacterized protein n=1 Tax=Tenacibaculum aiptasiae TaxID=426481 RepID=A0A7J5A8K8_9FLAO|nr:hypothetical protein [Tenacibaculum aiptasiae]KAB1153901.1 hypothetical protein F7018_15555 [Tenacibaculum aiptasiae]
MGRIQFRFKYLVLFGFFLILQCDKKEITEQKDWNKISNSKKWSNYILFIQDYPQSKKAEEAINKSISLFDAGGCYRFNLSFDSYSKNHLFSQDSIINYDSIKNIALNYLVNGISKENKNLLEIKIPNTNQHYLISKGMFELKLPKSISNPYFQKTIIELTKAIKEYKEYLAKEWFNKPYKHLTKKEKKLLNENDFPRLIFWKHSKLPPIQPAKKDSTSYEP